MEKKRGERGVVGSYEVNVKGKVKVNELSMILSDVYFKIPECVFKRYLFDLKVKGQRSVTLRSNKFLR